MNRWLSSLALASALSMSIAALAQTPAPPPPHARTHNGATQTPDGYMARLDRLLRESRDKKARVVLRSFGEEVAGVVQDVGPGWVVLSNQDGQQILLQTHTVERAEIR
jgi:hypothetical protein